MKVCQNAYNITSGDYDLKDLLHIDDTESQVNDCRKAGIQAVKITSGTDAEFDEIDKFIDNLITRKKRPENENKVKPSS